MNWLNEEWAVEKTWRAYEGGRVGYIETSLWDRKKGRIIVVTVGVSSLRCSDTLIQCELTLCRMFRTILRLLFLSSKFGSLPFPLPLPTPLLHQPRHLLNLLSSVRPPSPQLQIALHPFLPSPFLLRFLTSSSD